MNLLRVVFVSPVGVVGGAEQVLLAALRAVSNPALVLLADGPLRAAAERLGVPTAVVPLTPAAAAIGDNALSPEWVAATFGTFGTVRRLRAALRRLRPDVVHTNGVKAHLLVAVAAPPGVPLTWHLHDFPSARRASRRLMAIARRRVTAAVAVSDAVRRDAADAFPGLLLTAIPNPVDVAHFAYGPGDPAALDRLAGLPPAPADTVRVGLVATYARWKGHAVFLDAVARLPRVRGYVVGGPVYATAGSQVTRDELEARAAALGLAGRVGFVPWRPDPLPVYRALDVVVHASTRPEPFGLTVAEAMSCGRPVVASAAGGVTELFTDGVDVLAVPPGDPDRLADAIARLAADPGVRARLGAAARTTALSRFDPGRFRRAIADFLASAVADA